MPSHPHFDLPPLVEAVFDASVEPGVPVELGTLESGFFGKFPEYDSHRQPWHTAQAQFGVQDGSALLPKVDLLLNGVRKWNRERTRGVLVGPAILAMNVLPPYGTFDDHAPRLRDLAATFLEMTKPRRVNWLGHRYINQVVMPLAAGESPAVYFRLYPNLASLGPGRHPPVAIQLEVARSFETVVVVTLGLGAIDTEKAVYTLDVFARTPGEFTGGADELVSWHKAAHLAVVDAFLGSITPEARHRFKEKTG